MIQTHLGNLFSSTPVAILQPRTAIAWQFEPNTVLRSGFGIFSDIMPGSIADLIGTNPPYVKTFQGGLLGTVGGTAIAPGVPNSAVDATVAANQSFGAGFQQGQLSAPRRSLTRQPAFRRSRLRRCPAANFTRRTSWSGASALSISSERQPACKAQYVGTRAVNQPYLTQVNGYQTVRRMPCSDVSRHSPRSQPIRDSRR